MKRRFFTILGVALALFALCAGCQKEDYRADSAQAGSVEASQAAAQAGYHGAGSPSSGAGVDGILDEYIANLRAFSYYSGALTLEPATGNRLAAARIHPVTYSLQYDYAIAPNGERQYDFFALDVRERAEFYEQVLEDEREFLAERLALEPSSEVAQAARSRALREVVTDCVGAGALQQLTESVLGWQTGVGVGGMEQELMAVDAVPESVMRAVCGDA